jgi:hypothetical protein
LSDSKEGQTVCITNILSDSKEGQTVAYLLEIISFVVKFPFLIAPNGQFRGVGQGIGKPEVFFIITSDIWTYILLKSTE